MRSEGSRWFGVEVEGGIMEINKHQSTTAGQESFDKTVAVFLGQREGGPLAPGSSPNIPFRVVQCAELSEDPTSSRSALALACPRPSSAGKLDQTYEVGACSNVENESPLNYPIYHIIGREEVVKKRAGGEGMGRGRRRRSPWPELAVK